jgi:DNA-binding transcriptional ArsR family regulator
MSSFPGEVKKTNRVQCAKSNVELTTLARTIEALYAVSNAVNSLVHGSQGGQDRDLDVKPGVFRFTGRGGQLSGAVREAVQFNRPARWLGFVADPIRLQIVRSLYEAGEATAADLASQVLASSQTLRRHLEALVTFGVIVERPGESDGETPGRPAARFSLHEDLRESVRSVFQVAR